MELYFKFVMTLGLGLFGLGLVLTLAIDQLFSDWDAFASAGAWLRDAYRGKGLRLLERAEDVQLEIEKARQPVINTRLIDKRREALREIASVEYRLNLPNQPIVLTPLAPPQPPAETVSNA